MSDVMSPSVVSARAALHTYGAHCDAASRVLGDKVADDLVKRLAEMAITLAEDSNIKGVLINGQGTQRTLHDIPSTPAYKPLVDKFRRLQFDTRNATRMFQFHYGLPLEHVGQELKFLSSPNGSSAQEPHLDSDHTDRHSLLISLSAAEGQLATHLPTFPLRQSPYGDVKGVIDVDADDESPEQKEEMRRRLTYLLNPLHSPFFSTRAARIGDYSLIRHNAFHFGPPNRSNCLRHTAFMAIGPPAAASTKNDPSAYEFQVFASVLLQKYFGADDPLFICAMLQNFRDRPLTHHLPELHKYTSSALKKASAAMLKHAKTLAKLAKQPPAEIDDGSLDDGAFALTLVC
jgi:hypothetical protein